MIRIFPLGWHSNRQPFAYAALRDLVAEDITITQTANDADMIVIAHSKAFAAHGAELLDWSVHKKIVLLSEEPFWDTIWGDNPFEKHQTVVLDQGELPFYYLNHATTTIYDFEKIPYFLLTDHRFIARYATRFQKNATLSPDDWNAHFKNASYQAAFVAEKRMGERFAVQFPEHDTFGMCRFRSQLTQIYQTGRVHRAGLGWGKAPRRQDLTDWHLEKLLELDMRCRFVSALENTHQPSYLSEKLFDAFAVGAVPLYYASKMHRVHRLGLDGAWVNLFDLTPETACDAMDTLALDSDFLAAYCKAQQKLAEIFCNPVHLLLERRRFGQALIAAFEAVQSA